METSLTKTRRKRVCGSRKGETQCTFVFCFEQARVNTQILSHLFTFEWQHPVCSTNFSKPFPCSVALVCESVESADGGATLNVAVRDRNQINRKPVGT